MPDYSHAMIQPLNMDLGACMQPKTALKIPIGIDDFKEAPIQP